MTVHVYLDAQEPDTARYDAARCPECGAEHDAATGVGASAGKLPEPGSLTVCIQCASVLVFELEPGEARFSFRVATLKETSDAPPELFNAVRAVLMLPNRRHK
jgi:hypothetical protein